MSTHQKRRYRHPRQLEPLGCVPTDRGRVWTHFVNFAAASAVTASPSSVMVVGVTLQATRENLAQTLVGSSAGRYPAPFWRDRWRWHTRAPREGQRGIKCRVIRLRARLIIICKQRDAAAADEPGLA